MDNHIQSITIFGVLKCERVFHHKLYLIARDIIITDYEAFYEKLLELHNEFRAMHNAGELVLENKVSNKHVYLFIVLIVTFTI